MILAPLAELVASGRSVDHGAFGLAAWIRFLRATDESGAPIEINDPNASELVERANECENDVNPFLDDASIFPSELKADPGFRKAVNDAYRSIRKNGTRAALRVVGQDG